mmetsp:Transcript_10470/g.28819  ORF Transcript_10470/g.28819 Transcript_10470/m.28819 type:complete len:263 (+) Transcript_10470:774-1562(+)
MTTHDNACHVLLVSRCRRRVRLLLRLDLLDDGINLFLAEHLLVAMSSDDANLHGLGAAVDDLEQGLDGHSHARRLRHCVLLLLHLLFQELAQRLGIAASDDLRLPPAVGSGRIGLVEEGTAFAGLVVVDSRHERGDTERTHSSALRVSLLHSGQVTGEVVDGWRILHREAVALRLDAELVDEDAGIGRQSSECQHGAVVHGHDLSDGSRVLQFGNRSLLNCEDDAVRSLNAHHGGASADCLHGVFDLQQMPVWAEHCDRAIV